MKTNMVVPSRVSFGGCNREVSASLFVDGRIVTAIYYMY